MAMRSLQWLHPVPASQYGAALFDFDGTLSLIRAGWQPIMYGYFAEVLLGTPRAESNERVMAVVKEFVDRLTGQQTIYQCLQLVEEVAERGGSPLSPQAYKREYLRRLSLHTAGRVEALESGEQDAESFLVPGSRAVLQDLRNRGLRLFLASGTDEPDVIREAEALGIAGFFEGNIFGALEAYQDFSKARIIRKRILPLLDSSQSLLGFGDGYVEIENVRAVGGTAIGIVSDEYRPGQTDPWKEKRLGDAGAHCLMPDFSSWPELAKLLWREE